MSTTHPMKLSRELRFGLGRAEPAAVESRNGFAGEPALDGIAPFLTLTAQICGTVDSDTGMLLNIKRIDTILRETGAAMARSHFAARPGTGGADLLVKLFHAIRRELADAERRELVELELGLSPYLRLAVTKERPEMVQLTERFEFSAAHRLMSPALSEAANREVFGRCYNPNGHGHNYELDVTVEGTPDLQTGMVMRISELQRIVNARVIDAFDHKHLNVDCAEFTALNPTVENIARVIYEKLHDGFDGAARLRRVRVWETRKTWAEYPA